MSGTGSDSLCEWPNHFRRFVVSIYAVTAAINQMDLGRYRTQITQTYSGGNKRKLSLAIALIAAPKVVFLGTSSLVCLWVIRRAPMHEVCSLSVKCVV